MKKALPKIPKGKSIFKWFCWFDLIYLSIFAAITALILFSNIGIVKYILALIPATFCGITLIKKDDVSIAHSVYFILRNFTAQRNFTIDGIELQNTRDLQNITEIHGGYAKFKNSICAFFIEISDISFLLLDESVQEILQKTFGKAFNKLNIYNSISLVKTERLVDFAEFYKSINKRISYVVKDKGYSHGEKNARLEILKSKIEQFREYDGVATETVYHLIIRGGQEETEKNAKEIVEKLNAVGLSASLATAKHIAIALKSQYFADIDIKGVDNMNAKELAGWALPNNVCIGNIDINTDGKKMRIYAIKEMPTFVDNAWLATLCNIPEVNVTINAGYAHKRKTVRKIDSSYYSVGSDSERTSRLSEAVTNGAMQSSMESLLEDMTYEQDKLCYVDIYIAFLDDEEGKNRKFVIEAINDLKMQLSICKYNQVKVLHNYLIQATVKPSSENKQLMTTYLLGKGFPMVFPNLLESEGELIGENKYGMPIVLDFFKRDGKLRVNSNMCVFGKSGGGKSFFLKLYVIQAAARGNVVYIVDPEDEYSTLSKAMGAMVINLNDGRFKINPLHVYSIDVDGLNSVSAHVEVLETIIKLLFSDLTSELILLFKQTVLSLYEKMGITDVIDVRKIMPSEFPIFSDLLAHLEICIENEHDADMRGEYKKLKLYIKALTIGQYGKLWNGTSSITMKSNFVIFNAQSLLASNNLVLANAQMQLLTRYLNVQMINNYQAMKRGESYKKIILLFDEVHRFLDPRMTVTLDMLNWAAKQCRKYEAALVTASQSVIDFAATAELLAKTKALLTESQMNFLFGAKSTHVTDIRRIYSEANFTEAEIDGIKSANRGEVLAMVSDMLRLQVSIKANPTEYGSCIRPADVVEELDKKGVL